MIRTLDLKPDECAVSFAMRVAAHHAFGSIKELSLVTGIYMKRIQTGLPNAIEALASWQDISRERLSKYQFSSGQIVRFGHAEVRRSQLKVGVIRYCRSCLKDDLDSGIGRPESRSYLRGHWSWRVISCCPSHRTWLEEATVDDAFETGLASLAKETSSAADVEPPTEAQAACDEYLIGRVLGRNRGTFLDSLPAYVAAELCGVIGTFVECSRKGAMTSRPVGGLLAPKALADGFEEARHGKQAIQAFLTSCVSQSFSRLPAYRSNYSPAYEWLRKKTADPDFTTVVDLFQEHAENHLAFQEGSTFLRPVESAKVFSAVAASKVYGITEDRIRRIVTDLDARLYENDPMLFHKDAVHEYLLAEAECLTVPEAAAELGTTIPQLTNILDRDLLAFEVNNPDSPRPFRRIRKAVVKEFAATVFSKASEISSTADMTPILRANAICGCTSVEIIQLLLNGQLRHVALTDGRGRLDHLLINVAEVSDALASACKKRTEYLSAKDASRFLKTSHFTTDELIQRELLPTVKLPNHRTKVPHVCVAKSALEDFGREYMSLYEFSKAMRTSEKGAKKLLDAHGLQPLYEPFGRGARFYNRATLEALIY